MCAAISNVEVEVKAVSDPIMDLKVMVYQVKYDSVNKKFPAASVASVSARPSPTQRLKSRQ